ncbi:MAG: alkaline phosphatase family protein, partial [Candidatus Jordarchaeaceae archaeon]
MMPVLSVFIDSLMPESVENMEFLSCFESMARVKSELPSYSNTCHASMYTGVYPNKHKHFFIWKYSPETSPFRSLQKLKLHKVFNSTIIKYLLYASICKIKYEIVPYGFLFFARQSMDRWSAFDFKTVKFWGEPDMYVGNYPTIFKILNDANVKYQILWIPKGSLNKVGMESPNTFIYVFIGHIDPVTHLYGQNSVEGRKKLREIDGLLEKFYLNFKKMYENFYFLVFSDHGQTEIRERIDLYSLFSKNGKDLNDYLHFIDSC